MILSIDIGGTAVKLGLVTPSGEIVARHEASVSFDGYKTPILTTVIREARAFLDREGKSARNIGSIENAEGIESIEGIEGIEGIGVSATGQIDDRAGVVIGTNGKIPGYEGTRIRDELERAFGLPVRVLNDANAAALGECFAGAGKGARNVLMLTLGTGVGGGILLDGRLFTGTRGIAGELGHFTLYQDGAPCPCGKRGCFENYAATTALVRAAQAATGETALDGRAIFARAGAGDQQMLAVLDRWLGDIAAGITGLVHILNPEVVLIGGGVSAQEALLMQPLRARVLSGVMPRFAEGLSIRRAALGNDAGLIGAAMFFSQNR